MSGAESLSGWLAPARTALLIIDPQVDFAAPSGAMAAAGADLSAVPAALAACGRLAASARAAGVLVAFVALRTTAETDSAAWAVRARRLGVRGEGGLCRAGTPGEAFVGVHPELGDLVIRKSRYSAFFGTALAEALRQRGIDTLVMGGLTTECCVDCTARDAFHMDFQVFLAEDACAAYEHVLHEGALKALALNCAILALSDDIVAAWSPSQDL